MLHCGIMSRKCLFQHILSNGGFSAATRESVKAFLIGRGVNESLVDRSYSTISSTVSKIKDKWTKSSRHMARFLVHNSEWLEREVIPSEGVPAALGRPRKRFADKSSHGKWRETQSLTRHAADKLLNAAKRRARSEGRKDLSFVLKVKADFKILITRGAPRIFSWGAAIF